MNAAFMVDGCGIRLRFAYRVAQVCDADSRDHGRVAENTWCAGKAEKKSNAGAKKTRRDVDVDFVEESGVQQLLNRVGAMDRDRLPAGGCFRLVHGAFNAVGHE